MNRPRGKNAEKTMDKEKQQNKLNLMNFECDYCGKKFKTNYEKQSHEIVHTGKKAFKCEICYKSFTHKHSLNTHKKIHLGQKDHKCDYCGMKFITKQNLNEHLSVHTGKKWECDYCHKKFSQHSHLIAHKKIHTGRAWKCPENGCEYKTGQKADLTKHIRVHTNERPFKCPELNCSYASAQSSHLKRHQRSHKTSRREKSARTSSENPCSIPVANFQNEKERESCGPFQLICNIKLNNQTKNCGFRTKSHEKLAAHFNSVHKIPRVILQKTQ